MLIRILKGDNFIMNANSQVNLYNHIIGDIYLTFEILNWIMDDFLFINDFSNANCIFIKATLCSLNLTSKCLTVLPIWMLLKDP